MGERRNQEEIQNVLKLNENKNTALYLNLQDVIKAVRMKKIISPNACIRKEKEKISKQWIHLQL